VNDRAKLRMPKFLSSIALRLVVTVLATGILAFATIGGLAMLRLDYGLKEQADALGHLSARQIANRLDGEAQLARARIEAIGSETSLRLRQIAQRADVAKAVASRNDITIRELLATIAKTSEVQRLIAFDKDGVPIGVNETADLLAVNAEVLNSDLASNLHSVLKENSRSNPRGHQGTNVVSPGLLDALRLPPQLTIAYEVIEPVFDDFGDLVGALGGLRILSRTEHTLENFSTLSNAGVVIMHGSKVVSGAGPSASFSTMRPDDNGLIRSDSGAHVARCADHDASLNICTFTDASIVTATRDQMFKIGAAETRSLMRQFLFVAAITLLMLVASLLAVVRHATLGLSTLASAAKAVAAGFIDRPFKPLGVGEVYNLGIAFEQMLNNLRASMGKIRQLAFYDGVTGLPNRERLRLDAGKLIEKSKCGALCFLDLDGFKSINDTFGHAAGDLLLRKVSERLTKFFSVIADAKDEDGVTLARVGGDEFVIIIAGEHDHRFLEKMATDLLERFRNPFEINGPHVNIGASIGITIFPEDGANYEELLINADLAMYAAKAKGRNRVAFFTSEISENAKLKLALEQDLKTAIREKQLSVHYQPTISCSDGSVRGVEALARWQHPTLGNIPPERFIAIAEEVGLVQEIDRFVLQRAIEDIGDLIEAREEFILATNVSAASIEDRFFGRDVATLIESANFNPSQLELEITETIAMRDPESVCESIIVLRQLGIRFAIDDFGAGYSNLATLARLQFDTVKLDRSLTAGLASDSEKQTIVRSGLNLASELGFETVVEGIERREDFEFIVNAGATYAQGFLFSAPVAFDELAVWLRPARLGAIAAAALSMRDDREADLFRPNTKVANR
jgi:diguanylate cyclase (GGDEF)-like protein